MKKIIPYLIPFFFLLIPLTINAQQKGEQSTNTIPEEFKVVINGRLLNKENSPLINKEVFLYEVGMAKDKPMVQIKWDKEKCVGPRALTDSLGNFKFELDKRSWIAKEKAGFALGTPFDLKKDIGITSMIVPVYDDIVIGHLFIDPKGLPILVGIDKETKIKNLGDINILE